MQHFHLNKLPEKFQNVIIPAEEKTEEPPKEQQHSSRPLVNSPASFHPATWQDGQIDFNVLINDFETQLIIQAMKLSDGNKKEAARLLSLKRTTLLEKIKKKDIEGLWEK